MLKNGLSKTLDWVDERLPVKKVWREHLTEYYAPKNFNFWYIFGALAMLILVNQVVTGIWLTMYYTPTASGAFASVEYIMRDVNYGWLFRYLHAVGASAFFLIIYLHMFRAMMYGSYKKPRELLWVIGVALYIMIMAEAFLGYLLPWGQMSYWGAQVIISLFGSIPVVGHGLALWIRGDFNVSGATLNRFFALHVIAIPLMLMFLVYMHIIALHKVGSNNPDGIEIKENKDEKGIPKDGIPFHPYYTVKDIFAAAVFLIIFLGIVFFLPEMGGYFLEHANFLPADPLQTPAYIAPLWYMTPFYAMLRAVPDKLLGVIIMQAGIAILFILPWLDRSPVKSIRYRGAFSKVALTIFVITFLALMYLGLVPVTPFRALLAKIFTLLYFLYFILMPVYTRYETCKPVPERVR